MDYTLKFPLSEMGELAGRYVEKNRDQPDEDKIEREVGPAVMQRGWYTKSEFLFVCRWKTPRTQSRCAQNDEEYIREITSIALASSNERLRIEALTLLEGVSWPTASVLLHFAHAERYPILDFRALESLGIPMPNDYDFRFWKNYVETCREVASKAGVTMRTLDRALWQHSSERRRA